jgi:hypothetical protein
MVNTHLIPNEGGNIMRRDYAIEFKTGSDGVEFFILLQTDWIPVVKGESLMHCVCEYIGEYQKFTDAMAAMAMHKNMGRCWDGVGVR